MIESPFLAFPSMEIKMCNPPLESDYPSGITNELDSPSLPSGTTSTMWYSSPMMLPSYLNSASCSSVLITHTSLIADLSTLSISCI